MDHAAGSHAAMRPFGDAADLNLEFGQDDRPGLVTALLAQCAEPRDATFWWGQPVGLRTATMLRLVALTEQRDAISMSGHCTAAGCGEPFEFELPLHALADFGTDGGPLQVQLNDDRSVTLRRPTGYDLRRWRDARASSHAEALRLMLDTLVLAGNVGPRDEAALSASINAIDPLVDFSVACACPVCGAPNEVPVDLETLALGRLLTRQRELLREVHQFASRYGWTESEVLAVPPARRARYLALIEDGQ